MPVVASQPTMTTRLVVNQADIPFVGEKGGTIGYLLVFVQILPQVGVKS